MHSLIFFITSAAIVCGTIMKINQVVGLQTPTSAYRQYVKLQLWFGPLHTRRTHWPYVRLGDYTYKLFVKWPLILIL